MRQMITPETIKENGERFKAQLGRFIDFTADNAIMANNADWLMNLEYIPFLREIGMHFSVNRMLTAECFKSRMEKGLSFLEFNYMIMQAYDFLELNRRHGCVMQLGGDDQWSNIIAGTDLIRRKEGKQAYGMTFNLLTTSDGKKMGKTMAGAVWLDREKTTPYEFFQYWRNIEDASVEKCLALLTFLPMDEVRRLGALEGSEINHAKEVLETIAECYQYCSGYGEPPYNVVKKELKENLKAVDVETICQFVCVNGELHGKQTDHQNFGSKSG